MALAAGAWRWQQEHGAGSSSEVCKIITKMTVLVLAQITSDRLVHNWQVLLYFLIRAAGLLMMLWCVDWTLWGQGPPKTI
jgi:hypothetical protein